MMSTHVHMQGTESVIVCVCVYVCIQACVFSLMATAPHFYFYVKVGICWPLIIVNMCACVCLVVWPNSVTALRGWRLITKEHPRARMTGRKKERETETGGGVEGSKKIEVGRAREGGNGKECFTVEEGEIKRDRGGDWRRLFFWGGCMREDRKSEEGDWGPSNMDTFTVVR